MNKDTLGAIGKVMMCLIAICAIGTSFISGDPLKDVVASIYFVGAAIFLKLK